MGKTATIEFRENQVRKLARISSYSKFSTPFCREGNTSLTRGYEAPHKPLLARRPEHNVCCKKWILTCLQIRSSRSCSVSWRWVHYLHFVRFSTRSNGLEACFSRFSHRQPNRDVRLRVNSFFWKSIIKIPALPCFLCCSVSPVLVCGRSSEVFRLVAIHCNLTSRLPVIFPCCLCQPKSYHLSREGSLQSSSHNKRIVIKENSDTV